MSIADNPDVRARVTTPIGVVELWAQSGTTVLVRAGSELVNRYADPPETHERLQLKRGVEVDRVHWHYNRQTDGSWKPYSVGSARRENGSDLPPTAETQLHETIAAAITEWESTGTLDRAAAIKRANDAGERRAMAETLRTIAAQYDAEADELDAGGNTVYLTGRTTSGFRAHWRAVKRPDGTYSPGVEELPSGTHARPAPADRITDVREDD